METLRRTLALIGHLEMTESPGGEFAYWNFIEIQQGEIFNHAYCRKNSCFKNRAWLLDQGEAT